MKNSVTELRHFCSGEDIKSKNNVVSNYLLHYSLEEEIKKLKSVVTQLQKEVAELKKLVSAGTLTKEQKLQKIKELVELNQKVTISTIKHELRLNASNYARMLMKEAAERFNFVFFTGVKGQESWLAKREPDNKVMWAYAEIYQELLSKPRGTTISESAIAHRFGLTGQEVNSVICHLARHPEIYIVLPQNRRGCRRVKRVR